MDQELEFQYLCKDVHLIAKIVLIKILMISIGGQEFTKETIDKVLKLCDNDYIQGLSILGGEPMNPINIEGTTKLAKAFKEKYPNKDVWAWSGYTYENYLKDKEVLNYLDVIVDGQYEDEKHNPTLKWRGSENQRVINVPETLKENKVILKCD